MEGLGMGLTFAACIGILIAIRLLANMDNIIGKIFRWYWNTSFKLAAFIPFCGWMTHFIIAKTPEAKKAKANMVAQGEATDNMAFGWAEQSAARQKAELAAQEAQMAAEREARARQEAELQRMFWQKEGRNDVQLTNDPNYVKVGGEHIVSVKEFTDYMRS